MSRNIATFAFVFIITSADAQEAPQVKLVKTVAVFTLPDFDETFHVIDIAVAEAKRLRAQTVKVEAPVRAPRHRQQVTSRQFASHMERYCAKPGKDTKSWLRMNGRRFYCPA